MATKVEVKLDSPIYTFASPELREKLLGEGEQAVDTEEQQTELAKIKETFNVEDLSTNLTFTLNIETFLWELFLNLKTPEAPLKAKAHEKVLQDVAAELDRTMESDEELPLLKEKYLKKVLHFVLDPEEFKHVKPPFSFESGDKKGAIPLPAVNVLSSSTFLDLIQTIFDPIMEEDENG